MIEKQFNETNGILYVRSSGKIYLKDMIDGMEYLRISDELPRNMKILENASEAEALFERKDITEIIKVLFSILPQFKTFRHAVIHTDPTNTAYTILAAGMLQHPNYSLKAFSTEIAAENWLNLFD
jgi:hypothetical protein